MTSKADQTIFEFEETSEMIGREDRRLLNKLKADFMVQSYETDHLTSMFRELLGDSKSRKTGDYLPQDRIKTKKDGRNYLKIGEAKIFYKNEDISDIINFNMRSRLYLG